MRATARTRRPLVEVPARTDPRLPWRRIGICAQFGAPIVNRGGDTSLSGETVNFAVVIDDSKYLTPDLDRACVTVETAAINEQVNVQTGKFGLVFGLIRRLIPGARSAAMSATTRAECTPCSRSCTDPARARPTTPTQLKLLPMAATASGGCE